MTDGTSLSVATGQRRSYFGDSGWEARMAPIAANGRGMSSERCSEYMDRTEWCDSSTDYSGPHSLKEYFLD